MKEAPTYPKARRASEGFWAQQPYHIELVGCFLNLRVTVAPRQANTECGTRYEKRPCSFARAFVKFRVRDTESKKMTPCEENLDPAGSTSVASCCCSAGRDSPTKVTAPVTDFLASRTFRYLVVCALNRDSVAVREGCCTCFCLHTLL